MNSAFFLSPAVMVVVVMMAAAAETSVEPALHTIVSATAYNKQDCTREYAPPIRQPLPLWQPRPQVHIGPTGRPIG